MNDLDNRDSEILLRFGQTIRALRKEKGWSQDEFAHNSGLHRTYIGSVERGERNISLLNIFKIANTLEVSVSDLFYFGTENE